MRDAFDRPCPCGTGVGYGSCCGPLHHGARHAVTAEELMRSRYAAYAVGDADYLFRTWHPRTRPADLRLDPEIAWSALEVNNTTGGRADDDRGEVEFTAVYEGGSMHERSRFERRAGRWVYLCGTPHAE